MDRVLRDTRLADGRHVDVHIEDGAIAAVEATGGEIPLGASVDDLEGWLLLPAMAEPHAHFDKALTAERVPNPTGDLPGAIDAWVAAAERGAFTHDDMVERASRAMELLLVHGITAVRTHVNVGDAVGSSSVLAIQEARDGFAGLLDVQIVALTHSPMTGPGSSSNRAALDAAVEAGVDLIGGCPQMEADGPAMISHALAVAADAGLDVDLHTDETLDPSSMEVREIARQVQDIGFPHRVTASHCVSLGVQSPEVQAEVAAEISAAGIAVVPLPQTNLFLQGRHHPSATPRGLTAIPALRDAGVLVGAGADNVQDPFNLVGRSDGLETAALLVMAGHQLPADAYRLVSADVRAIMGLPQVAIQPGDPADLVAIDAPSIRGAIADAPMSRRTYRAGRLVASSEQTSTIHRE